MDLLFHELNPLKGFQPFTLTLLYPLKTAWNLYYLSSD